MRKRILFICIIFMFPLITSCLQNSTDTSDFGDIYRDKAAASSAIDNEKKTRDNLPELNFKGREIKILYYNSDELIEQYVGFEGIIGGDIVSDAIYKRNLAVEERLGVKLAFVNAGVSRSEYPELVRRIVGSGDETYELMMLVQYNGVPLALEGSFRNLSGAPYIELSQPWWSEVFINESTIGKGTVYFLTGDVMIDALRFQSCAYFNKDLYKTIIGEPDEMYETVLGGRWDFDTLDRLIKDSYSDLNGDGKIDSNDRFGCLLSAGSVTDHFMVNAGVRYTSRDNDGIPYLTLNNERNAGVVECIYKLYKQTPAAHLPQIATTDDVINKFQNKFISGDSLFIFAFFYYAEAFRDMKDDYGIIPYPKYDESQSGYISLMHDTAAIYAVPVTVKELEPVCAALEAMASEGYKTITPAYYEVALKTKYVRDNISSKVIDIIHDSLTTDFAYVYNYALNGIATIMRTIIKSDSPNFASTYASMEEKAQSGLESLISMYSLYE